MPLPRPSKNEKQDEFISRCAGDTMMNKDFPETKQRVAVCYSQWKQAKKKKVAKGSDEDPTWEEHKADIDKAGAITWDI